MIKLDLYRTEDQSCRCLIWKRTRISKAKIYWAADHDLEPSRGRDGLERREAARRNVGELQVLRDGEVARETDSSLNRDDVEESEHRRAALFLKYANWI